MQGLSGAQDRRSEDMLHGDAAGRQSLADGTEVVHSLPLTAVVEQSDLWPSDWSGIERIDSLHLETGETPRLYPQNEMPDVHHRPAAEVRSLSQSLKPLSFPLPARCAATACLQRKAQARLLNMPSAVCYNNCASALVNLLVECLNMACL